MGAESVWSFVGRIRPKERCVLVGDQMSDVHVDSHVLATLRDVMEDEYALLLETFLTDSDERLRLLREAEAQDDSLAMRMAAHSFKGSCSNMGAVLLAGLCKQLEDLARREQLDDVAALLAHIEREFAIVRILFKSERQRHR